MGRIQALMGRRRDRIGPTGSRKKSSFTHRTNFPSPDDWLFPVIELSKWRWGSREEVGGRNFFPHGVEKEVGVEFLSSIIEERGKWRNKLSTWCMSFIRNLFKRSSHCLPQYNLIIISSVGVIEIQVIEIYTCILNTFKVFCILYFVIEIQLDCILCNWNIYV